jgi:catechol 2,3-dioxygenase-like lactoylglutathione lyase family enzyme
MAQVRNFDHVTLSVRDLPAARRFFAVLNFREEAAVVIKGPPFDEFMGVPGIEADHVTMVLEGSDPRMEVQLLHYRVPPPVDEPGIRDLHRLGLNHICFAVDDIHAVAAKLAAEGFKPRNRIMDFRHCRLVFIDGPEGVTVELSERR